LVVSGTLSPDATGTYYPDGAYNGQNSWRRGDGSYFIWYLLDTGINYWNISNAKGQWATEEWFIADTVIPDVRSNNYQPYGSSPPTGTATVS